jgi:large subunit ribosomal protein L25
VALLERLRREGFVPGVVYGGQDGDCTSFKVQARALRQVLVGGQALIDLKVGSKTRPVIVKDQQLHPVRDEVMHIDLLEVRLDEKIQTTVGVHVEGAEESPGVKEGGVLEHVTHQLNIEALPTAIPDYIAVDVSNMEIAATMHLSELTAPEGVEFLDDPEDTIIATVVVPTEVEEPEIEEETVLVGEDGEPLEEGAEPAEGEEREGAEGEPAAEEAEGSE